MRRHILNITLFILLFESAGIAQDFKKDMLKMRLALKSSTSVNINMEYEIHLDAIGSKPYDTRDARLVKSGENYFYSDLNTEFLVNANHLVLLDKKGKRMTVNPRPDKKMAAGQFERFTNDFFGKAVDVYENAQYQEYGNNRASYRLTFQEGIYESTEITFSKSTFLVETVTHIFRKKLELKGVEGAHRIIAVIRYEQQDIEEATIKVLFSDSKYFKVSGDSVIAAPKFKNYKVKYEAIDF